MTTALTPTMRLALRGAVYRANDERWQIAPEPGRNATVRALLARGLAEWITTLSAHYAVVLTEAGEAARAQLFRRRRR